MIEYEIGDVIRYYTFGGKIWRDVQVTNKEADVKNGQPGFDGVIVATNEQRPAFMEPFVWGYDDQVTEVRRRRAPASATLSTHWLIRDIETGVYWTHEGDGINVSHWFTTNVDDAGRFSKITDARDQLEAIQESDANERPLELVLVTEEVRRG